MTEFKVGDEIVLRIEAGSPPRNKRVITAIGKTKVLYEVCRTGEEYHVEFERIAKVEPFFEVGKTYRFPSSTLSTFKIRSLHSFEGGRYALAEYSARGTGEYLNLLEEDDFTGMIEIED